MSGDSSILPMVAIGVATGGVGLVAAGAGGAALAGMTATQTMMAGTAALSAGSQLYGGAMQSAAYKVEEAQARLKQKAVNTEQAIKDAARSRNLANIISSQRATTAARGISLGIGTPLQIEQVDTAKAMKQSSIEQAGSRVRSGILGLSAKSASNAAKSSLVGGILKAGVTGAQGYQNIETVRQG